MNKTWRLGVTCVVLSFVVTSALQDGNPHGWDRQRRCDHDDALVEPPCGVCEGVGGVPFGDENHEIELAPCEPVASPANLDPETLIRPIWGQRFTVENASQVIIGPKHDPLCLQAGPSNSSKGRLCYQFDFGRQVYDMVKAKAIRLDVQVDTKIGRIPSTILHQGPHFWILNQLPSYLGSQHLCICSNVHEGASIFARGQTYGPIASNWTDAMKFVGRERIVVEYGVGSRILDHWALGPHHVWTFPSTGYIQRMYQPFNGLQVFPQGNGNTSIDETLFEDIPPAMCKRKGGAVRLFCDDEGYHQDRQESDQLQFAEFM